MGLANIEHQIPISDNSLFNIASNSKQMTTLLAFMLVDEGRLSFSDNIKKYLPELEHLPYDITLAELTNHTHGLPNVDELAQLKGIERMTHDEVLNMLFEIKQFNFPPGDHFQYNNTGYVLLAEIIERVEKQSFAQQLKEKIFDPLGMVQSQAVGDYNRVIMHKAYSYASTADDILNNPVRISTMGASGVYASLNDLILWAQNFTQKDARHQEYFQQMLKATKLKNGKVVEYGMGIQFENYKGIDIVFHGGGTESYRSYVLHVPEEQLSLVYLSNAGGFTGYELVYSALNMLLSDRIKEPQPVQDAVDLSTYAGTYELMPGGYYTVWAEEDSLFFKTLGSAEKIALPKAGTDTFVFPFPYSKLIFYEDGFDLRWVDFTYPAKRIDSPAMEELEIDLNKFVGIYKNEAHNSIYELVLVDNQLVAKNPIHEDVTLDLFSETRMYARNSSFGKIDFIFDDQGTVEGFKLSRQNLIDLLYLK